MNCYNEIKKSKLNYSKYNFNTVKIRKEIYFTNNKLNNKNILDIYNKTKTKQEQIQIQNKFLLDNEFESFILSLKDYYNIEDEVLPFYEIFQENLLYNLNL